MKKVILLFLAITICSATFAQEYQWAQAAGWIGQDAARAVAVDEEGNVYVAGQYSGYATFDTIFIDGHGTYDAFLAKYNTEGAIQWVRHAGGPNEDYATGICIDTAGYIYITGYFLDSIYFDTLKLVSADLHDVFIAKYSPSGERVWAKRAGGRGEDRGYAITSNSRNEIAVAGEFEGTATFDQGHVTSSGDFDAFLAKYNSNGICQWVKKGGGSNDDAAKGVGADNFGNFFTTGYIYGNTVFDTVHLNTDPPTSTDIFITKYTSTGSLAWARRCDSYLGDNPYGIATDWAGYSYLTGYFQNETTFGTHTIHAEGYNDAFLAKYDPDGECDWAKAIGGNDLDLGTAVCTDDYGFVYVTGSFDTEIFFQDTDYIAPGYEVFIAKYFAEGDEVWTQIGGGAGNDFGNAIAVNKVGEVAVAGYYNLYGYFGPYTLQLSQQQDIFVTKLGNNVGVSEQLKSGSALLYPNPSSGEFFVEEDFGQNNPVTVTVTDIRGRMIYTSTEKPVGNKIKIMLSPETANGIYFLDAVNSMHSFSGKVILNK